MRHFARDGRLGRMLPSARTGTVLVAVLSVACALAAVLLVLTVVRPVPPDVRTPEVRIGRSAPPTTSSVVPTPGPVLPTPGSVLPPPPPGDDDDEDD
ncbi:hypothetical protein [Lentzea flaviverrucosa]|uniref:Uncharacterized protein n=1 Tax=Lentzea flaviverrucosa TaxID=200379 RepID=A0A1H9XEM1_9PSEU|nr:hypothetical protein [Lentzea flaviverrucosa]RDI21568.1 hypothetical protein DFR72_113114 [Lentzea flaviverrucosa]SES44113.1 hypothetical protein SAMN05216195_114165 [Lentzea flaviverrucosa]